jgi:hypothetical protein
MLKNCAANRKRWLSVLPNVGPYTHDVKISGFTRSSIYIYNISRLRVNKRCSVSTSLLHDYLPLPEPSFTALEFLNKNSPNK